MDPVFRHSRRATELLTLTSYLCLENLQGNQDTFIVLLLSTQLLVTPLQCGKYREKKILENTGAKESHSRDLTCSCGPRGGLV
jgi:hypothetical protein